MKKIYGNMSTDELMLELYRLREDLMRYQEAEAEEKSKTETSEDVDENIIEI